MNTHLKNFIFLLFSLCILAAFRVSGTTKSFVPHTSFQVTDDRDFLEVLPYSDTDLLF